MASDLANSQHTASEAADLPPGYEPTLRIRRFTKPQDRGLPQPDDLLLLARVYLDRQVRLWPGLTAIGGPGHAVIEGAEELASRFAEIFRAGRFPPFAFRAAHVGGKALAACYLRYSCENSNPRSLDDQLDAVLRAARERGHFIPWPYVLADSSVSGTLAVRRGYLMAKEALRPSNDRPPAETLYVYDMSRASRDIVESHQLARYARSVGRNILGVADGFDLSTPQADIQLSAMAMCSQMLIGNVRERVRMGMKGAATRGTSTGRVGLGYKLVAQRDALGRSVVSRHGKELKERAIDDATRDYVEMAYRMVGIEHKSYERVREQFNRLRVGGKNNWWVQDVIKLLSNPIYIGVLIFNRTGTVVDPETGKLRRVDRPRQEWVIVKRPDLRIISDDLWRAARRRMHAVKEASPLKGRNPLARIRQHPKTLFSGTLVCAACRQPLKLFRGGENKFFRCPFGQRHVGGCKLRSKAVRTVEFALIEHIRATVLGPESEARLVKLVNACIAEEVSRPKPNLEMLRRESKRVTGVIRELTEAIVGRPAGGVRPIVERIEGLERERREVQRQLSDAERTAARPVRPVTLVDVQSALGQLREVLNQAPAMAAPVLRQITGEILVHAEPIPNRRRQVWVASFRNDIMPLLAERAAEETPLSYGLDLLQQRKWSFEVQGTIRFRSGPREKPVGAHDRYASYAKRVVELRSAGLNWSRIAVALSIAEGTAQNAYAYGVTGRTPWQLKQDGVFREVLICRERPGQPPSA